VLKPVENDASLSIVASFGLSLILQEGVRATYGRTPKRILDPIGVTFRCSAEIRVLSPVRGRGVGDRDRHLFLFLHRNQVSAPGCARCAGPGTRSRWALFVHFIGPSLGTRWRCSRRCRRPLTSVEFRLGLDVLPLCFIASSSAAWAISPAPRGGGLALGIGSRRHHQHREPTTATASSPSCS